MNAKEINVLKEEAAKEGYDISENDILYVILRQKISDSSIIYSALYGEINDEEISDYEKEKKLFFIKNKLFPKSQMITFEENRRELQDMIPKIRAKVADGSLSEKDGLVQEKDVRALLEKTFGTGNKEEGTQIIVNQRFEDVCPYCHHETPMPSKERCMEVYNLVERQK